MKVQQELVTPQQAQKYLDNSSINRKISKSHVDYLLEEMASGHWEMNHQPIAINKDGKLTDGQHRLMALTLYGSSLPMLVAHEAIGNATVDNCRSRNPMDRYNLMTGSSDTDRKAIAAARFFFYGYNSATERFKTHSWQLDDVFKKFGQAIETAIDTIPSATIPTIAALAKIMFLGHAGDSAELSIRVLSGVGLSEYEASFVRQMPRSRNASSRCYIHRNWQQFYMNTILEPTNKNRKVFRAEDNYPLDKKMHLISICFSAANE